jgi:DNA-binding transcriptional LysR family regulator
MVEHGLAAAFLPDMVVREAGSDVVPSSWLPSDQQRSIHYLVRAGSEHSVALVAVRDAIVRAFRQNSNL